MPKIASRISRKRLNAGQIRPDPNPAPQPIFRKSILYNNRNRQEDHQPSYTLPRILGQASYDSRRADRFLIHRRDNSRESQRILIFHQISRDRQRLFLKHQACGPSYARRGGYADKQTSFPLYREICNSSVP